MTTCSLLEKMEKNDGIIDFFCQHYSLSIAQSMDISWLSYKHNLLQCVCMHSMQGKLAGSNGCILFHTVMLDLEDISYGLMQASKLQMELRSYHSNLQCCSFCIVVFFVDNYIKICCLQTFRRNQPGKWNSSSSGFGSAQTTF